MTDSSFLLDPFSTIVYLALLTYKPANVKIGIEGNCITYFYDNWMDRIRRTLYDRVFQGYSRFAILHLKSPIKRAIEWYSDDTNTAVFALARSGLETLLRTYESDTSNTSKAIKELLVMYITLLKTAAEQPSSRRQRHDSGGMGDNFTEGELNSLRDAWTPAELDIITEMFKLINQAPVELQGARVNNIEVFASGKQPQLLKILHQRTRSL